MTFNTALIFENAIFVISYHNSIFSIFFVKLLQKSWFLLWPLPLKDSLYSFFLKTWPLYYMALDYKKKFPLFYARLVIWPVLKLQLKNHN